MFRVGWVVAVGGCLWIPAGKHEERLALAAFSIGELRFEPGGASACGGPDAALVGQASVGVDRAGQRFTVSVAVNGGTPAEVGESVASDEGWLSFPVAIEAWTSRPGCTTGCDLPVEVTIDRLGFEVAAEGVVSLLPPAVPELLEVELADTTGVRVPLADTPLTPDGAHPVGAWPELYLTLRDRHFALGLGGRGSIWYCPGDATPDSAPGACGFAPLAEVPAVVPGEQVFVGPTAFLGEQACDSSGAALEWHLFARVEGHVCGGPYTFALDPEPVVFVLDDCDHDGFPAGEDCNDLDAAQNPSALELCDAVDNNCDGVTLVEAATVIRQGLPPSNFLDLQLALDSAAPGDEVMVCKGTYEGPFTVDRDVTLSGATGDPAEVVLTGSGAGSVLLVSGVDRPSVVVRALTLSGGTAADSGGGLDARLAGTLVVEDAAILDNGALRAGGLAAAPITTLRRTTIRGNSASRGGGLTIPPDATVTLEATTIEENTAVDGAGVYANTVVDPVLGTSLRSVLALDAASTIRANVATYGGGGVMAVGDFELSGGLIDANDGPAGGGGVFLEAVYELTAIAPSAWSIHDVTITGNSSYYGGGVCTNAGEGSTLDLVRVHVATNTAEVGGGVLLGLIVGVLTDVTIESNDATFGGGLVADYSTIETSGGHVKWNGADEAAGLLVVHSEVVFGDPVATHVEFNEARDRGGGIFVEDASSVLDHRAGRVSGNTAIAGGGLVALAGTVTFGGSLEANLDAGIAAGFLLEGGSTVRVLDGAVVSANGTHDVREQAELEVCAGASVFDVFGQGNDLDCYTITDHGYVDGCGC